MDKAEIKDMVREAVREILDELDRKDSVEIGNSKTGIMKVYFNSAKPEDAKTRICSAVKLLLDNRKEILGE